MPLDPAAYFALSCSGLVWAMRRAEAFRRQLIFFGGLACKRSDCRSSSEIGARERFCRLLRLPRADWGKAIAHSGFGTMLAIALIAWEKEDIRVVDIGETWTLGPYDLTLGRPP